jgi:thiol-disulfide isomerase/thioredoxin
MLVRTVLFALALSAALAQSPETPPDLKAYTAASRTMDPQKKIDALEKWKKDFPDSEMQDSADQVILATLVKHFPQQQDRIRKLAADIYRTAPEKDRGSAANQIAGHLLDGNLLLKDAERYARKGVDSMRLAPYIEEQMAAAEKRKQKPKPEELQKRFVERRAARLATLGRIEVRIGRTAKGQKLLEEAYAGNPANPEVNAALGELAAKAGQDAKALEYLIPARLSGTAPKTASAALEAIYRKQHGGSADGLEAMLDAEYHKRFPNPVAVAPYHPDAGRTTRVVLAEVFTGSGCPPCAGADLAFEAAMARYPRKDFAVLMYHQHVPRPDPMTDPDTQARAKDYNVTGVPTYAIDGKKTVGGGPRDQAKSIFDRFSKDVEKDLDTPPEAHFSAAASLSGNVVDVRIAVQDVKSESKDLELRVVLVEKELRYNGENGIRFQPMVVRAVAGEPLGKQRTFHQTFDLADISRAIKTHLDDYEAKGHRGETFRFSEKKYQIDRGDLAVVAFVQDDQTKHVLQAAYIDLGDDAASHSVTEAGNLKQ